MKKILILFSSSIILSSCSVNQPTSNVQTSVTSVPTVPNLNKSSKEYALMGRQVFSAFQCATWASIMEEESESDRLFKYGYEQGKTFVSAIENDKIEQEDISSNVPIAVTWLLGGPNEDFVLGKIYSSAEDEATKDIYSVEDELTSEETQKIIANDRYTEGNCQFLGAK